MPTEKSESKPETTEDPATDEEHPQDALRREGLRLNPQFQTEHLDTTGGGPVDLHRISPTFQEAREHAVRAAAAAADADEDVDISNVVFSDDHDEAERERDRARRLAEKVPDEEPDRRPPGTYADGMGGPYGQGVVVGADGEPVNTNEKGETEDPGAAETSSPVAAPATKATAGDDLKGDADSDKTEAKSTSSSSRTTSSAASKPATKSSTSSSSSTAKKNESTK